LLGIITNLHGCCKTSRLHSSTPGWNWRKPREDRADYELKLEELGMDKDDAVERAEVCQLSLEEMSAEVAGSAPSASRHASSGVCCKRTDSTAWRTAPGHAHGLYR
jgi:hypothetical protein